MDARKGQYADMVNKYYDLATSFYEYGEAEAGNTVPRGANHQPHAVP